MRGGGALDRGSSRPIVEIVKDQGDGIIAVPNDEVNTVPVEKQLWDGLSDEEKANKILVNGGTNPAGNKEATITIKKVDDNGKPIKGVKFELYKSEADAKNKFNSLLSATTDDNGIAEFKYLDLGDVYVREISAPNDYKISDKIYNFYVDDGTRFLGEVSSEELISGDDLANKIGLTAGYSQNSDGGWLKYQDKDGKILYVAKKPLIRNISWDSINNVGAVFGKEIDINGQAYKLRLMRGLNEGEDIKSIKSYSWSSVDPQPFLYGSEYNRLILPVVKNADGERYGSSTKKIFSSNMPEIAQYKFFRNEGTTGNDSINETNNLGNNGHGTYNGQSKWMQETTTYSSGRLYRGSDDSGYAAATWSYTWSNFSDGKRGWLPVLEFATN